MRQLFDMNIAARQVETNGTTVSKFRLTPYDPLGTLMPVADVNISGTILSGIPLSPNNRELQNILPGTPVKLTRSITGRMEVTGVNKRGGTNATYFYTFALPQLTPQVSNSTSALSQGSLTSTGSVGFTTKKATLGDLQDAGTFGIVPLGATILLDLEGNIIQVT